MPNAQCNTNANYTVGLTGQKVGLVFTANIFNRGLSNGIILIRVHKYVVYRMWNVFARDEGKGYKIFGKSHCTSSITKSTLAWECSLADMMQTSHIGVPIFHSQHWLLTPSSHRCRVWKAVMMAQETGIPSPTCKT